MAKIDRFNGNLQAFGSSAQGNERTVFGDITQSDSLDDNITADWLRGWGIVGVNENPTKQDFNGLAFTLGQLLAYLHQMGVPEWNINQEYQIGSVATTPDGVYRSLIADNVGIDPDTDDGTNWEKAPTRAEINNRVIRVGSRTEMKGYDVPAEYQFGFEGSLWEVKSGTPPSDPDEDVYVVLDNENYAERIFTEQEYVNVSQDDSFGSELLSDFVSRNKTGELIVTTGTIVPYVVDLAGVDYSGLRINGFDFVRRQPSGSYFAQKPEGFPFSVDFYAYVNRSGEMIHNFNADQYNLSVNGGAVDDEYFVDNATGVNGSDGTDPAAPLRSINRALDNLDAAAGTSFIVWVAPGYYAQTDTWLREVTKNVTFLPWNGETTSPYLADTGRVVCAAETEGLSWTATGSGSYSAARSGVKCVADEGVLNSEGEWSVYEKVESIAECDSTPGSWYDDGADVYVHTADSRAPDADVHPYIGLANGVIGTGDITVYVERFDFFGGNEGMAIDGEVGNTETVVMKDCSFKYSGGNGFENYGGQNCFLVDCNASYNGSDGFNYHSDRGTLGKATNNVEINCFSRRNGGSWSLTQDINNGSTAHDEVRVARFGCSYSLNQGPNVADVGNSKAWNFYVSSSESARTVLNINASDFTFSGAAVEAWMDFCDTHGSHRCISAANGGIVKIRNCELYPRLEGIEAMEAY